MPLKLGSIMIALCLMACASPEPPPGGKSASGLRKVMITEADAVDRLRALGLEVIVQQPDYVVVRQDSSHLQALREAGITTLPAQEADLVQRLVRVHFSDREQKQQIIDMGIDFWEQEGDSLLARAFDIHLSRLQAAGIGYRILANDASKREVKP